MAFESGNRFGSRAKLFDQALKRAIAQDNGTRLRACAEKILDLAAAGEPWAVRELADRLDGKAVQFADISISDKRPEEMTDDDLLRIATGSGAGTSEPPNGEEVSSSVH